GFDLATVTGLPGHYGLLGLRERTRLLHGELEIQSQPGAGTRICFSFPVHQSSATTTEEDAVR
ncbi:MAG TPA: hypothetical protein VFU49_02730, partial [Ktedonobacteraceae bacterium]|nr:hypothetical protein [Ktedonobacteraceae bacterium]